MKQLFLIMWFVILLILSACNSDSGSTGLIPSGTTPVDDSIKSHSGKLEKGAFQKGAEIIAYGWDSDTGFTDSVGTTTTSDDLGSYTLKSSKIKDLIYVKAEGYFYNENTGILSDSTLKLYAIIDSAKEVWNINVVSHIIRPRVMYLIEEGSTYNSAINQAMTELYTGLGWTAVDPGTISIVTNANLLFLSASICKNRAVAQISDILTTLSNDLLDGTIDLSILNDSFSSIDVATVRSNMTTKYGSCVDFSTVKANVLALRGLTDTTIKTYTVTSIIPYEGVNWYIGAIPVILYMKDSKGDSFNHLSVSQTYLGVTTDITEINNISEFFSIGTGASKILYFTLSLPEGVVKNYKQEGGVITEIASLPDKPARVTQSLSDGFYNYTNPNLSDGIHIWNIGTLYGYKICEDYVEGIYHRGKTILVEHGADGIMMLGTDYTYTENGGFMYGTWNGRFW